jgi:hypothetical protein
MKVSNFFVVILAATLMICTNLSNAATFVVTSNLDNTNPGTLRWAINMANTSAGQDNINFNLPSGQLVITLTSNLPVLSDAAGVIIDGYTQPGAIPNTNPQGQNSNAVLKVTINGNNTFDGIYISTWNNTISGLVISSFYRGIVIDGSLDEASRNSIVGCYIGTDYTGTVAVPNFIGISVINGAGNTSNYIGDGTNGGRNLISGNAFYGIEISGTGTKQTIIRGNYIGTEKNGVSALGNVASGVRIQNGASLNQVAFYSYTSGDRNIISGNGVIDPWPFHTNNYDGVDITGAGTSNNIVGCNYIGTDCTGSYAIPNGKYGVAIFGGASNNIVSGDGNSNLSVISGNTAGGVWIEGAGTDYNSVGGAYIGLDATGSFAIPNNEDGVYVNNGAQCNNIGLFGSGGLMICGNLRDGVRIEDTGTNYNLIRKTSIGVSGLGNGGNGIHILNGPVYNQIGGNFMEINYISYNAMHGILIDNAQYNSVINTGFIFSQIINNGGDGIAVLNPNSFGNKFSTNIINNNGGLGIDLNDDGVTYNDAGDPDSGPNNLLNFPVITSAVNIGGAYTVVSGTIDIGPNPELASVEIFLAVPPDPSGHGEAFFPEGNNITPSPSGSWSVTTGGYYPVYPGDLITAITIDQYGNTSEFSENVMVTEAPLQYDYSDAPDPPYPTLISSNGAGHGIVTGGPFLGNPLDFPDPEPDGLPFMQPQALGDDLTGNDDENGVSIISPLYSGLFGTISIEAQNGPAWVDAWFDFNGNGIWGDMGGAEYIISGLLNPGINVVSFVIPAAAVNQQTYARFRINSSGPLTPTGLATDGEVEDYDMPVSALWVGGTPGAENDWSNPNNWSNGVVPTGLDDLVIPGGLTYPPVISGNANCDDIFILDGGILTLNAGANLVASGNMTIGQGISGQLIVNAGSGQVIGTTLINPGGAIHIYGGTFIP